MSQRESRHSWPRRNNWSSKSPPQNPSQQLIQMDCCCPLFTSAIRAWSFWSSRSERRCASPINRPDSSAIQSHGRLSRIDRRSRQSPFGRRIEPRSRRVRDQRGRLGQAGRTGRRRWRRWQVRLRPRRRQAPRENQTSLASGDGLHPRCACYLSVQCSVFSVLLKKVVSGISFF